MTIIFLTITVSGFGQTIEGKVIDGSRKKMISYSPLQLLDSAATAIKGTVMTDEEGRFKITHVSIGVYSIRISSIGYKDTTFRDINISGDTMLKLDIHRFCQYDSLENNKTCPVCHKRDKVIPIVYGLLISTKGEDPLKDDGKTFKSGGCNISYCDPHWYCKRDKTEF